MAESPVIGIDLGGTRIKIGLVREGRVRRFSILQAYPHQGLAALLPELQDQIVRLSKPEPKAIKGIGLAFPGIVDSDRSQVLETSGKYADACDIDMVGWARELFGLPLKMDNDARLACLGEWRYGAGRGASDLVMMTLGTGIGTSAVIHGQLLRGKHFRAGILGGHIVTDYKDQTDRCSCGKHGCLEAVASMWSIQKIARRHPLYPKSTLSQRNHISWELLIRHSEQGDELAGILKGHCLEVWAVGMVNLVNAYDPERVVIGGGISNTEAIILPCFREALASRAWYRGLPEIRMAEFPDSAALLGAEALFQ